MQKKYYSIQEAMQKLDVSRTTIYKWMANGFLKPERIMERNAFPTKHIDCIRDERIKAGHIA